MEVFGLPLLPHDIAYAISRHPKKLGTPENLARLAPCSDGIHAISPAVASSDACDGRCSVTLRSLAVARWLSRTIMSLRPVIQSALRRHTENALQVSG